MSWLQNQNQTASNAAAYQSSIVSQASAALSNATGVNLDTELTNMLNIENSYTTYGEAADVQSPACFQRF